MDTKLPPAKSNGPSSSSTRIGCALLSLLFLAGGVGFMVLFAARAWRDIRIFTAWQPAQCTIISLEIGSQRSSRVRTGGPYIAGRSESYRPEITFRYVVDGIEYDCTGWDSWALAGDYGGGSHKYYLRVLDRYEIGQTYPCWYDPADPSQAVLVRRVRPLYILALFPLALVALGGLGLVATLSRARPVPAPEPIPASTAQQDPPGYRQRLAVRIDPVTAGDQKGCLFILAALMLAVGALAGFAAYQSWIDGEIPVVTGLVMVAFGASGTILLMAAVSAMVFQVPVPILEAERPTVAAGARLQMRLVQPGPVRLKTIRVTLVGEKLPPAKSGTPSVKGFFERVVIDTGHLVVGRMAPLARNMDLVLPADAPPSSSGQEEPEVRWRVQVTLIPFGWPRLTYLFPVVVTPSSTEPSSDDAQ